jgi:hypothetical protein
MRRYEIDTQCAFYRIERCLKPRVNLDYDWTFIANNEIDAIRPD